jgi:hypothetical protein
VKTSAIIVTLHRPLRFLPGPLVEALSKILFQWFRGADATHDQRWRRLWANLFHSKTPEPSLSLYVVQERSGVFHARHMAIEGRIFENQEQFLTRNGFRTWLKTGAAFGRFVATPAGLVFEPSSTSYDDCSDDEMREFHEDAIRFLQTPRALMELWPHITHPERVLMLETWLRNPTADEKDAND